MFSDENIYHQTGNFCDEVPRDKLEAAWVIKFYV